jgi:hypothetical protein
VNADASDSSPVTGVALSITLVLSKALATPLTVPFAAAAMSAAAVRSIALETTALEIMVDGTMLTLVAAMRRATVTDKSGEGKNADRALDSDRVYMSLVEGLRHGRIHCSLQCFTLCRTCGWSTKGVGLCTQPCARMSEMLMIRRREHRKISGFGNLVPSTSFPFCLPGATMD